MWGQSMWLSKVVMEAPYCDRRKSRPLQLEDLIIDSSPRSNPVLNLPKATLTGGNNNLMVFYCRSRGRTYSPSLRTLTCDIAETFPRYRFGPRGGSWGGCVTKSVSCHTLHCGVWAGSWDWKGRKCGEVKVQFPARKRAPGLPRTNRHNGTPICS